MPTDSTSRFTKNVIPMDEVLTRTGLSRSMLYKLLRKDKFPHPTPMSNRAVGWFETDVESWLQASKAIRHANLVLPVVYMAGKMGAAIHNGNPGGEFSCWRIFDVSRSDALGDLGIVNSDTDVLIAPPEEMLFHGTRTRFMYSGPWKARNGSHGQHAWCECLLSFQPPKRCLPRSSSRHLTSRRCCRLSRRPRGFWNVG